MFESEIEPTTDRDVLLARFRDIRAASLNLAAPLSAEDQMVQSMPDVSPTKWHLAHTTWFFETFLLTPNLDGYAPFDDRFGYLFNSYYEAVGERHPRAERGLLTRPDLPTVMAYRAHVEAAMERLIAEAGPNAWPDVERMTQLGLHHEQQHQELILMDIKHVLSVNPLQPAYLHRAVTRGSAVPAADWIHHPGGLCEIGHEGEGFTFDNEGPRHKVWLEPFALMDRLVTAGEYNAFMADGGYQKPEFWLSEGWAAVQAEGWEAPLYWRREAEGWSVFTLNGRRPVDPAEPVCHVSHFEADAYARWAGRRLPTEAEWEVAATTALNVTALTGNLADQGAFHPQPAAPGEGLRQLVGDVWEWTQSPYVAYPRFRPVAGAVGEYNGKFMSGQMVLRGGAAVTPPGHVRLTYRNFFPPAARWAFSGIRLADDA